jgi:hypothetical protein
MRVRASVLIRGFVLAVALMTIGVLSVSAAPSFAASGAWWHLDSTAYPTQLQSGGTGDIFVSAVNRGYEDASGTGTPIVLSDKLPAGVEATNVTGRAAPDFSTATPVSPPYPECGYTAHEVSCSYVGVVKPYSRLWMVVAVRIAAAPAPEEASRIAVSGAEISGNAIASALKLAGGEVPFGIEKYELAPEEVGGGIATQAGVHPFQLTTTVAFNKTGRVPIFNDNKNLPLQPQMPKDVNVKLPPGLIGNPTPFPECTAAQFTKTEEQHSNACPQNTAVGYADVTVDEPNIFGIRIFSSPVFNLTPERGEPARFGFTVYSAPIYLDTSVRTGGDYGVTVHVGNISQLVTLLSSEVTFWGVPGDPRHDGDRGWACGISEIAEYVNPPPCKLQEEQDPKPLLVTPTSCTGPLQTGVEADSWKEPEHVLTGGPTTPTLGSDGCNRLNFEPKISVTPDNQEGSTASGLGVKIHVPQSASLQPEGISEANVKDTTVTLPEGLALDPAAADGLQSCSIAQVALESAGPATCPEAAKVGTVTIHTPLLPDPLTGAAYLAAQNANPFGSLVALYVVVEDPQAGVLVKLAGEVQLSATGQIVTTFKNTPQLPFEDFELNFFGGARAPLSTPAHCGTYTTQASIGPWSGTEAVTSNSSFNITSGPNGRPCPGSALPFSPSLTAGMTNINAGAFSPLTTTIGREDGQQNISSVQLHFPPGLSGILAGLPLCGEAEANAGTCSSASRVGEVTVSVGLGGDPYTVTDGKVYITGPYHGAPFGLSIVTPAVAGPYNLGTVVVRGKLEVDPHTAALTFTSNDESEGYAIPHILDGIPLQIKHINVTVNRPGFTFNPTDCNATSITGSIGSVEGASSAVQEKFQVTNCASLKFAPKFAVSTSGKTSKAGGASLTAKLSYLNAPQGTQANITRVKVDLPKQLPSRLTTLQKACTNAQFEANPAGCPSESKIGYAKVTTPLLPVPLEGPAIFVSHGGEAFPSLTMVLQGYGVTIDLVGTTFISKAGITSTTFKTVPDVPFNTFTLTLPEGKYSALAANGNLCASSLSMPTEFLAQNGSKINEPTPIGVEGCSSSISVLSHSLKGGTLKVSVSVPVAGKLAASGKGLSKASKNSKGRETIKLTLHRIKTGKLSTKLKLTFTPSTGTDRKKQTKSLTAKFKK